MSYYAFYFLADPDGNITSVSEMTQAEADDAVAANPLLGYALAPGAIDPAAYYVVGGVVTARPTAAASLPYFCFYKAADALGAIVQVASLTQAEADLMVAADPTLGYVSAPSLISTADYYITGSPKVLTAKATFGVTFNSYSIPANGTTAATLTSSLPSGTTIALLGDDRTLTGTTGYGVPEMSQVYTSGAFTLTSTTRGPHRLRFTKTNYVTEEVTINVV